MTLKSFAQKLLGIRRMKDPVFGELRFQKLGFWEGSIFFRPVNATVEVLIDSRESGPTDQQRQFLEEIDKRYESLFEQALSKIQEDSNKNAWSELIRSEDMKLEAIDIPMVTSQAELNLTYLHIPTGFHCEVRFSGWEVTDILVEPC